MNSLDTRKRSMVFLLKQNQSRGFTIIELLIIFAILAVLSTIAVFSYTQLISKARYITAVEDIRNIASLLDAFYVDNDAYPNNLDQVGVGALRDPWGNPYQYINIATAQGNQWRKDRNNHPINTYYDLWSNGPDGQYQFQVRAAKSRDDIIRAQDGAFIGLGKELDEMFQE
jgi:general secretion pathway protein G